MDARQTLLAGLPVIERRIAVAGVSTLVLDAGHGPTLILLHGGVEAGGAYWAPLIPALAQRYHLVVPDAPGLGESAPLLMIGMVAFVVDIPKGFTDSATALPVQVFLWSDSPERGFVEKTSGAIIVLLAFLVVMNTTAVILRKRFERRW